MGNPHGLLPFEIAHRDEAKTDNPFGKEGVITHKNGFQIRTDVHMADYVRVCDPDGNEIAYWSIDELRDDPAEIISSLFSAVIRRP